MKSMAIKRLSEQAIFVVDTLGYNNQISTLDLRLATQAITSGVGVFEDTEALEDEPQPPKQ